MFVSNFPLYIPECLHGRNSSMVEWGEDVRGGRFEFRDVAFLGVSGLIVKPGREHLQ